MPGLLRNSPVRQQRQFSPADQQITSDSPTSAVLHHPAPPAADVGESPPNTGGDRSLMSGYNDCAFEAVRFLVEHERCHLDHPTVVALAEHLQAKSAYLEYLALLERSTDGAEDELTARLRCDNSAEQPELSAQQHRLVEAAFRGCDLVMSDDVTQPPTNQSATPPNIDKWRFSNQYLDQILAWAYCGEDDI